MRMQNYLTAFLMSWLLTLSCRAEVTEFEPLPHIQASAEQHLASLLAGQSGTLHVKAAALDNRLRLAACSAPLETFLPSGANIGSRVTTGVRCTQGNQWTVYVPVDVQVEIPTLALNKPVARGVTLSIQDVDTHLQLVPGVASNYIKSMTEVTGKRLKRALPAGTLLTPDMFEPELLIRRGQTVTVLAKVAGIEVRSQGVALTDGSVSSRIQVKNLTSAKVVEGRVDSNSVVQVDL